MSLITETAEDATSIQLIQTDRIDEWLATQGGSARAWLAKQQFRARSGEVGWLPDDAGNPISVVVGWDGENNLATLGGLPFTLAEGAYQLDQPLSELQLLGWGLGAYQFNRYKEAKRRPAELLVPEALDAEHLANNVAAIGLARDLINLPADDLTPSRLAEEAVQLADTHGGSADVIVGDELLARNFSAIHAVGRAAVDAPRLIDIAWGHPDHPRVSLIGKGVCFDSGGLDIKPASGMRTMKKDMGGAANVLGLAQLIMAAQLPVRLRVLIPAVENAISGNAYRPGDILSTYKGLTVEIDNTDAEGRLVMCDALALAAEDSPDLMLDYSTLTGSARSAVGAEIAAMFSNNDSLAEGLIEAGTELDDPIWRMPLHQPYEYLLKSHVADTVNSASTPYGGAITAALFLQKFVGDTPWAHFDIMAYNTRSRPGRPEGGEAMGIRAAFQYLRSRYGH